MKNLSKALALFVVVAMMLTSVVSVSAFTDVVPGETTNANAIDVCAALGLIQGYEDGSFQPEGSITRAEFAAIVVRMLGQESQAAGSASATSFTDVPADHWAAGYINIATSLGIINGHGDGTFGPEDPVLYEQAVKMLVVAMGYCKDVDASGYPVAYLTQANTLGLTTAVYGENGAAANRGQIAQLVFNALDKPLMKTLGYGIYAQPVVCDGSGDTVKATILDEYLDIVKLSVNVTDSTAMKSSTNKAEKVTVTILNNYKSRYGENNDETTFEKGSSKKLNVGSTNASEYVGSKAVVYVSYVDGYLEDAEIVYIAKDASIVSESIDSFQYESTTAKTGYDIVEYRETSSDRTTQSFTFNNDPKKNAIYVNGVKYTGSLKSILDKFYGVVEFTNNATSNEYDYDTAFVTDYDTIVVDAVNTKTSRVTSKNSKSLTYANSDKTIKATLYGVDGAEMDWADLKEWDVISFTETETATKVIVAYVIDNAIEGKVMGISGDDYTIGDGEYNIVDEYLSGDEPQLGDEGIYYLDIMGNIVWYDTTEGSANDNYAYIKAAKIYEDFNNELQLRMFTADGSIANYDLYSTVRYNGKAIKAEDMAITDTTDADYYDYESELTGAFVVFKTNAAGEITSIDTPETWTASSKSSDFTVYGSQVNSEYTAATGGLTTSAARVYVTEKTKIFVVGSREADYEIYSLNTLVDEDKLSQATFYNVDDDLNVGAVLVKGGIVTSNAKSAPIAVAISDGQTTDADGYTVKSIKAFSELAETTYVSDANYVIDTPVAGSVFVPKFTNSGAIKSYTELTNVDLSKMEVSKGSDAKDSTSGSTTVKFYFDDVKEVTNKRVTLADNTDLVVPATANVYVVDGRISTVKNRVVEGDINYLDYNKDDDVFEDGGDKVTDYVMFAREINGKIADVVLYINYSLKLISK